MRVSIAAYGGKGVEFGNIFAVELLRLEQRDNDIGRVFEHG